MKIVIDTNILISALIKDSMSRKLIVRLQSDFYIPENCIKELLRHRELIIEKAGVSDSIFRDVLFDLLKRIKILTDEEILNYKFEAEKLMNHIDDTDSVFLAAAIAVKADYIWSNDKHFKQQNKIAALTTEEVITLLSRGEL